MNLNEEEVKIILDHRKKIEEQKQRAEKQANCQHEWHWVCSCHNDDAYDCSKCGATKYE